MTKRQKPIKGKHKQLFLSLQFGGVRIIIVHNRWQQLKPTEPKTDKRQNEV